MSTAEGSAPHVPSESFWMRIIGVLSVTIVAAVAFLILGPRPEGLQGQLDVSALPVVNASLNLITMLLPDDQISSDLMNSSHPTLRCRDVRLKLVRLKLVVQRI